MPTTFALSRLYQRVQARFAAEGFDVPMAFGWLAPSEQIAGLARITWTPGDEGGALGVIGPPKYVGGTPRQLATLAELCTVEIAAFEPTRAGDEIAQYEVTRELFDAWLRAVRLEAHGTYTIVSAKWIGGDRVRRAGGAIRVVLAVQAPILDQDTDTATVDAGASITVRELDAIEPLAVPST